MYTLISLAAGQLNVVMCKSGTFGLVDLTNEFLCNKSVCTEYMTRSMILPLARGFFRKKIGFSHYLFGAERRFAYILLRSNTRRCIWMRMPR
uniref:Uncharacterized protein n=1 Tax=Ixodes scapularis TaxID=6945 RepID=A0A4D5RDQ8_IXOSC